MKRIFTLGLSLLAGMMAFAQVDNSVVFIDKDGNEVADGSTVVVNEVEESEFGELQMVVPFRAKKNVSGPVFVRLSSDLAQMPVGTSYSCCFPENCTLSEKQEVFNSVAGFLSDDVKGIQTEWLPTKTNDDTGEQDMVYATWSATVQIQIMDEEDKSEIKAYGPKVTVKFVNADPAGISAVGSAADNKVVAVYDASGARLSAPQKGLNIVRLANGKTVKRVVK